MTASSESGEATFWRMEAERHGYWPEDDPDEDPVQWEQDREAERHQAHLDRVHGGSDCDCPF